MKKMTSEDIQRVSLEILRDIHSFCVENDIFYTLCGGTLIGAIRHNGFVPWDDDIDIAMPRPDYDKFICTYRSKSGYKLLSREVQGGDKGVYIAYSRVCEMEKTYVDTSYQPWSAYNTGIWIDIMPLDGASSVETEEKKRLALAKRTFLCLGWARKSVVPFWKARSVFDFFKLIYCVLFFYKRYKAADKLIEICRKEDYKTSSYFTDLSVVHYGLKEYNSKELLRDKILWPFGQDNFYVLSGFDSWLRHIYGDYMKLPPKEKQVKPHDFNEYYWK